MSDPRKAQKVEAAEAKRRAEQLEEERRAARLARAEARRERHAALARRLAREVLYAGEGVSQLLHHIESDEAALARRGLPVLHDAADLAELLEVDIRRLRWLTFHREVAAVTHYRQFHIPKAKGGVRTIAAPRPALRAAQARIRAELLQKLDVTAEAHAFVPGRSTLTNARPHVGQAILVKADIEDFFGTITFPRVRGLFRSLGYSGMVSTLLALLTTEAKRVAAEVDGATLYVATGPRSLPQGALTSPELTNQISRTLDHRLLGYARKHGWAYTRYADDLSFSRPDGERAAVGPLLGTIARVLAGEGFRLNRDKVFVSRAGRQQRVTGIVVNRQTGLPRTQLRRFRAAVHRVGREGFRDEGERRRLLGYAAYVRMVKPELGARLLAALAAAPGRGGAS
ncbi:MAG: reverse transcriptase family protein [Planctomycetota bacterium]